MIVGYRGIKGSSPYKARISVGCGARRHTSVKRFGNEIQDHLSNRPSEEGKFGSGIEWVGSKIAWLEVKVVWVVSFVKG